MVSLLCESLGRTSDSNRQSSGRISPSVCNMGNVNIIASVSLDCCVVVVTPFCCLILFFFWFLDGCFLVGVVVVAAGLWKERSEFGNWFSDVVCCWEGLLGLNH